MTGCGEAKPRLHYTPRGKYTVAWDASRESITASGQPVVTRRGRRSGHPSRLSHASRRSADTQHMKESAMTRGAATTRRGVGSTRSYVT
ncbi:hypothetical protein EYF80_048021 [Liparis tanakae]|uniref:Uncharacterized protein n=1 Tax=Liparis tanakae TaxID=230148 RepID=A0A4Z2FLP8_9TELE|nr:hypothetical protein EYF80_048021 [Liparis tanakae]